MGAEMCIRDRFEVQYFGVRSKTRIKRPFKKVKGVPRHYIYGLGKISTHKFLSFLNSNGAKHCVSLTLKNSTYHTDAVNESTKKHDVEKVRRKGGVRETQLMALPFIST